MEDWLWSPVPRRLRVRGTVVVGHTRLPLRVFLLAAGFAVAAALLVVLGAPLARVALLAPVCGMTLLVVEGSWAGRSTRTVCEIGVTHLLRPHHLRLQPTTLVLATHQPRSATLTIRWAKEHGDERR